MTENQVTPKRTLSRRKAAEKSEKRWKEALEEEQTYEALPDVFLGTRIGPGSKEKSLHSGTSKTKGGTSSTKNNFKAHSDKPKEVNPSTHLQDSTLKTIVESLACVICFSQALSIKLTKNNMGETEELTIICSKCNKSLFHKVISQKASQTTICNTVSPISSSTGEPKNDDWGKKSDKDQGNTGSNDVELLVCDVDVMKEDQPKNSEDEQNQTINQQNFRSPSPIDDTGTEGSDDFLFDSSKTKQQRSPLVKPIRPCFFCSKMQARLSRHVKTTHASHPYVQAMLLQPQRIQARMMRQLRSEGIFAENQRRLRAGRADLLRIRNQGSGELSACVYCRGYYKKKLLWRHRATCIARPSDAPPEQDLWAELGEEGTEGNSPPNCPLNPNGEDNNNTEEGSKEQSQQRSGDPSDPPEISRIREILDGLEHGIFSQEGGPVPPVVNGVVIKQERVEPEELVNGEYPNREGDTESPQHSPPPTVPTAVHKNNFNHHLHHPEVTLNEGSEDLRTGGEITTNEDQLLFDSLPAILNNSNASDHAGAVPIYNTSPSKKRKGELWKHDQSFTDENYYYMWPDVAANDLLHQELLPCNTLYQSNRKRRSRSEFQYQFWKKEDEVTILNYFTELIKSMKVPGKDACREFLSKHPDIQTDWTRVKYKVYNQIQKQKKKMNKEL